jgi:hypothetical protein
VLATACCLNVIYRKECQEKNNPRTKGDAFRSFDIRSHFRLMVGRKSNAFLVLSDLPLRVCVFYASI